MLVAEHGDLMIGCESLGDGVKELPPCFIKAIKYREEAQGSILNFFSHEEAFAWDGLNDAALGKFFVGLFDCVAGEVTFARSLVDGGNAVSGLEDLFANVSGNGLNYLAVFGQARVKIELAQ